MDKRHLEKPGKHMEHSSSDAAERFRRSLYTSPDRHQEQQELDEGRNTQEQSWQTEAREGLRHFDQSSDTPPAHRELTHTQLQDAASFAARQSSPSNAEIAIQRRRSSRELREQQRDTGSEGERHIQEDPDSARRTV